MLQGTDSNAMASTLIRNTLLTIRQKYPELADVLAKQMSQSGLAGMGDVLSDFGSFLNNAATTALTLYKDKQTADSAANTAKAAAEAELQKQQAALAAAQAQATTAQAQAAIQQQQLQLKQYQAQLQSANIKTLVFGGIAIVIGVLFLGSGKGRAKRR